MRLLSHHASGDTWKAPPTAANSIEINMLEKYHIHLLDWFHVTRITRKKIQAFFNKTYRNRSNVQRYHEKSHHPTQDFTPELTLHAAGNTNLNLRYDLEHWATNQTSKSSETPPTSTTIGPDTIDPRSPPQHRSCHLGKGSEGLGDDQSLLSAWVLLMMEEKQLRLWGWPISIGAWFLWTISI